MPTWPERVQNYRSKPVGDNAPIPTGFRTVGVFEDGRKRYQPPLDRPPVTQREACRTACRLHWTRESGEVSFGVSDQDGRLISRCPVPGGDI